MTLVTLDVVRCSCTRRTHDTCAEVSVAGSRAAMVICSSNSLSGSVRRASGSVIRSISDLLSRIRRSACSRQHFSNKSQSCTGSSRNASWPILTSGNDDEGTSKFAENPDDFPLTSGVLARELYVGKFWAPATDTKSSHRLHSLTGGTLVLQPSSDDSTPHDNTCTRDFRT